MARKCKQCDAPYLVSRSEAHFFRARHLELPARCPRCRAQAKMSRIQGTHESDWRMSDSEIPLPAIPIEPGPTPDCPRPSRPSSGLHERLDPREAFLRGSVPVPRHVDQMPIRQVGSRSMGQVGKGLSAPVARDFGPVAAFREGGRHVVLPVDVERDWKRRKRW